MYSFKKFILVLTYQITAWYNYYNKYISNVKGGHSMKVTSTIDRKIPGFPMWSKGKVYNVLNKETEGNRIIVKIKDDVGRIHWMAVGSTFIIQS